MSPDLETDSTQPIQSQCLPLSEESRHLQEYTTIRINFSCI